MRTQGRPRGGDVGVRSRRGILLGATVVAAGGVGVMATEASPFRPPPGDSTGSLASLRGALPAACARVMALDLAGDPSGQKPPALKAALTRVKQSVAAVDRDGVDAWLALGSRVFAGGVPGGAQRPRQLEGNLRPLLGICSTRNSRTATCSYR